MGPVTSIAAVKWNIECLAAARPTSSLEVTIAEVKLGDFNGHTLQDWVHPGLNGPAADNDLK